MKTLAMIFLVVAVLALAGLGPAHAQSYTRCLDQDGAVVLTTPWNPAAATCVKGAPALPPAATPVASPPAVPPRARPELTGLIPGSGSPDCEVMLPMPDGTATCATREWARHALTVRRDQATQEHDRDWATCDKAFRDFAYRDGSISLNRLPAGLRGRCARFIDR